MSESLEVKLARIEEKLDIVVDGQNDVHKAIFGNGEPGLKTEVDRLKIADMMAQKRSAWVLRLIIIVAGSLAGKILYDFLVFGSELAKLVNHAPK